MLAYVNYLTDLPTDRNGKPYEASATVPGRYVWKRECFQYQDAIDRALTVCRENTGNDAYGFPSRLQTACVEVVPMNEYHGMTPEAYAAYLEAPSLASIHWTSAEA